MRGEGTVALARWGVVPLRMYFVVPVLFTTWSVRKWARLAFIFVSELWYILLECFLIDADPLRDVEERGDDFIKTDTLHLWLVPS